MKSIKKALSKAASLFPDFDLELDNLDKKLKQINSPPDISKFQIELFPPTNQSPKKT